MNSLKYYLSQTFKYVYKDLNPATLTGAIDVIIVEQPDGTYKCGPFHVRFGKMGALVPADKVVDIFLNGHLVRDVHLKLGSAGEAFFVEEVPEEDSEAIDENLATSPIPCSSYADGLDKVGVDSPELQDDSLSNLQRTRSLESLNIDQELTTAASRKKLRRYRRVAVSESAADSSDEEGESFTQFYAGASKPDRTDFVDYDKDDIVLHCLSDNEISTSTVSKESSRLITCKSDSALDKAENLSEVELNMTWDWGNLPESSATFLGSSASENGEDRQLQNSANVDEVTAEPTPIVETSKPHPSDGSTAIAKEKTECGVYLEDLVTEKVDESTKNAYIYTQSHRFGGSGRYPASLDGCSSDAGYKSDGEYPMSPTPPYPVISELKLSLCGELNTEDTLSSGKFYEHLISYEDFLKEPDTILANTKLVVLFNGDYYPWTVAGPMILSILCFQTQLPHHSVRRLQDVHMPKKKSTKRKHWFWGSRQAEAEADASHEITGTNDLPPNTNTNQNTSPQPPQPQGKDAIAASPATTSLSALGKQDSKDSGTAKMYRKKIRLNSDEVKKLNLREGRNEIEYRVTTKYQGTTCCKAHIYLWRWTDRLVISDVDGTITRSDVLGHIMPIIGRDWTQLGVAKLFRNIESNGYRFVYLSARAIGQANITRNYLSQVVQDGSLSLPDGPIMLTPNSLIHAFHREVIERKPEIFKIQCMKDMQCLFPEGVPPLYAGFGNKPNDVIAYREVGIVNCRIFTVNPAGTLKNEASQVFKTTYRALSELVDHFFSVYKGSDDVDKAEPTEFSAYSYWREPLPDLPSDLELSTSQK